LNWFLYQGQTKTRLVATSLKIAECKEELIHRNNIYNMWWKTYGSFRHIMMNAYVSITVQLYRFIFQVFFGKACWLFFVTLNYTLFMSSTNCFPIRNSTSTEKYVWRTWCHPELGNFQMIKLDRKIHPSLLKESFLDLKVCKNCQLWMFTAFINRGLLLKLLSFSVIRRTIFF
jgi:hypothetical protein